MQANCATHTGISSVARIYQANVNFLTNFNIPRGMFGTIFAERERERERESERERETRDRCITRISRTRAKYKNNFPKFIHNLQYFFKKYYGFFLARRLRR